MVGDKSNMIKLPLKIESLKPVKRWHFESKSEKGVFRKVELWEDGELTCNCPAGFSKKILCWHKKEAMIEINLNKWKNWNK